MHILVAEDDKDVTEMYRIVLEARGHKVVTTNDGLKCLEIYIANRPYDVVILDYRLPMLDGLYVAKEILDIDIDQRIIFVSAYIKETLADAVKGLKRVVELISKPFEPELLADLVEDKKGLASIHELNITAHELVTRGAELNEIEIDNLLQQLKSIQKPNTI